MKILRQFITFLGCALLIFGCSKTSGGSADNLQEAVDTLAMVLHPSGTNISDTAIELNYDVDTVFNPEFSGRPLIQYLVAEGLRKGDAPMVKTALEALKKADLPIYINVVNQENIAKYGFTVAQLNSLRKAPRIDLDLPAVRAGVINLAESMNSAEFAKLDGVQNVSVGLENGFVTFTLQFDAKKKFDKSNQGLLTARYEPTFKAQLAALEKIFPGCAEALSSAGIDGYRVQYTVGSDGKVVLKEAFPWRVLH